MSEYLKNELRNLIQSRKCLVIVGAGLSLFTTNNNQVAGWSGLIKHGLERVRDLGRLVDGDEAIISAALEASGPEHLVAAAGLLTKRMGAPSGGEYRRWLNDTVGSLRVENSSLINELIELKVPIVTTNFDDLIEQVSGMPSLTWHDTSDVERVIRGDHSGVIHLHGVYSRPDSIVFDEERYAMRSASAHSNAMLQSIRMTDNLVYIGFGGGLADPTFGPFIRWSSEVLKGSVYRQYILTRNAEVERNRESFKGLDDIAIVGYGDNYSDMADYITGLRNQIQGKKQNTLSNKNDSTASPRKRLIFEQLAASGRINLRPIGDPYIREYDPEANHANSGNVFIYFPNFTYVSSAKSYESLPAVAVCFGSENVPNIKSALSPNLWAKLSSMSAAKIYKEDKEKLIGEIGHEIRYGMVAAISLPVRLFEDSNKTRRCRNAYRAMVNALIVPLGKLHISKLEYDRLQIHFMSTGNGRLDEFVVKSVKASLKDLSIIAAIDIGLSLDSQFAWNYVGRLLFWSVGAAVNGEKQVKWIQILEYAMQDDWQ